MPLKLIIAASEEPVDVPEFMEHARIDPPDSSNDFAIGDIRTKLFAARAHVERGVLLRALITSTWDWTMDCWPRKNRIDFPLGNLQSVTYGKYTDSLGEEQTVDSATYRLTRTYDPTLSADTDAGMGRLHLKYGQLWPQATLEGGDAIRWRIVAGWKDAASVPMDIKLAIQMLAAHWVRTREAVESGRATISRDVARSVADLCSPYMDRQF